MRDIVIAGGGAGGLFSALFLLRKGRKVTLVEKTEVLGKKLSLTGNGRCNICAAGLSEVSYGREAAAFTKAFSKAMSPGRLRLVLEDLGILTRKKGDGYYPASFSASNLRDYLEESIRRYEDTLLKISLSTSLVDYLPEEDGIRVVLMKDGKRFEEKAKHLILATGGSAFPSTGSDGNLFSLLEKKGILVHPSLPALVPIALDVDEALRKAWSGARFDGRLSLLTEEGLQEEEGQLQFTKDGVSGIPAFQISSYVSEELGKAKEKPQLRISLFSEEEAGKILHILDEKTGEEAHLRFDVFLRPFLPLPLIRAFSILLFHGANPRVSTLRPEEKEEFSRMLCTLSFPVKGTGDLTQAQGSLGGVDLSGLSLPAFSLKKDERVYVTGDLLHTRPRCGGYQLQLAIGSALLAAEDIERHR